MIPIWDACSGDVRGFRSETYLVDELIVSRVFGS
jgi:hypothetical protein